MSYGFIPYLVHTPSLRAFGQSGDPELVEDICRVLAEEIASLDEFYKVMYRKMAEVPKTRDLLLDMAFDKVPVQGLGAAYSYTFKVLCGYFGNALQNRAWYPADLSAIYLAQGFYSYELPLDFPTPADFPLIYFIDGEKTPFLQEKIERSREEGEHINEINNWLTAANTTNQDLYLFYH